MEGQREKSKIGVFGSGDVKEVSAIKQPCIHPETCQAAGGRSPSLYEEKPRIAEDSCRSLEKKGPEPALLFLVIWSPVVQGKRPSARRDVGLEGSFSGKKPFFHQF